MGQPNVVNQVESSSFFPSSNRLWIDYSKLQLHLPLGQTLSMSPTFIKVFLYALSAIIYDLGHTPFIVFLVIASCMNKNKISFLKNETICRLSSFAPATVRRALNIMEEKGYLKRIYRYQNGRQICNAYKILAPVVGIFGSERGWTSRCAQLSEVEPDPAPPEPESGHPEEASSGPELDTPGTHQPSEIPGCQGTDLPGDRQTGAQGGGTTLSGPTLFPACATADMSKGPENRITTSPITGERAVLDDSVYMVGTYKQQSSCPQDEVVSIPTSDPSTTPEPPKTRRKKREKRPLNATEQKLVDYGIGRKSAKKLFAEYGQEHIDNSIARLEEQMADQKIQKPAGYLWKIIVNNYVPPADKATTSTDRADNPSGESVTPDLPSPDLHARLPAETCLRVDRQASAAQTDIELQKERDRQILASFLEHSYHFYDCDPEEISRLVDQHGALAVAQTVHILDYTYRRNGLSIGTPIGLLRSMLFEGRSLAQPSVGYVAPEDLWLSYIEDPIERASKSFLVKLVETGNIINEEQLEELPRGLRERMVDDYDKEAAQTLQDLRFVGYRLDRFRQVSEDLIHQCTEAARQKHATAFALLDHVFREGCSTRVHRQIARQRALRFHSNDVTM